MPHAASRLLALLAAAAALACGERPREPFPGLALLARVEARLERERPALRPMLDHYGLLFPVEARELDAFMRQIRFHGDGDDLALGTAFAPESHGGGLLRLLFDHWRPDGRAPRLADGFRFESNGRALPLARIYEAQRRQLVLPETGLPRMRFRFALPGGPVRDVELDAWKLLGVLIEQEADPTRTWTNREGRALSVERLMERVREHYLARAAPAADPPDHSELHLVELLVAHGRVLEPVQARFLAADLGQQALAPADASFLLGHAAQSLGALLEAPELRWSEADARRVTAWLATLEAERFRDVDAEGLESLCHLAKGLRAVRAHRAKLELRRLSAAGRLEQPARELAQALGSRVRGPGGRLGLERRLLGERVHHLARERAHLAVDERARRGVEDRARRAARRGGERFDERAAGQEGREVREPAPPQLGEQQREQVLGLAVLELDAQVDAREQDAEARVRLGRKQRADLLRLRQRGDVARGRDHEVRRRDGGARRRPELALRVDDHQALGVRAAQQPIEGERVGEQRPEGLGLAGGRREAHAVLPGHHRAVERPHAERVGDGQVARLADGERSLDQRLVVERDDEDRQVLVQRAQIHREV
jgi:hypothetical protein